MDTMNDPARTSWVTSANAPETDFPIQNLPFGMFRRAGSSDAPRVGVAIGDMVLDVHAAATKAPAQFGGLALAMNACAQTSLNALMALGRGPVTLLRAALASALDANNGEAQSVLQQALIPMRDVG